MARLTKADLRAELQQRGFDGFQPGDLDRYIQWACDDIALRTRWSWKEAVLTFSLNAGEYRKSLITDLPTLDSVSAVEVTTLNYENRLSPMTDNQFYERWGSLDLTSSQWRGEPSSYWLGGAYLYILPPPLATRAVSVYGTQKQSELSDTQLPVFPEDYDRVWLLLAESYCHERARQYSLAGNNRLLADDYLEQAKSRDDFRDRERVDRVEPDNRWR